MTMLIVEYVPYVAFFAAGVLVAWVGADLLRSKRRKPAAAQESVRGLAGPAEPLRESAPQPEIPVSQAVQIVDEPVRQPEIEIAAVASAASEKIVMVKRDPSVRIFDTAVAPSERKVVAD